MARSSLTPACLAAIAVLWAAGAAYTQDIPQSSLGALRPDPNTASITGRVVLPSGSSADFNVKITLSNTQSPLTTLYSDKHGEFRFLNLSEGTYYVQISVDASSYEPVVEKVRIGRGQEARLTIPLRKKGKTVSSNPGPGVVSAPEFDQRVPAAAKKEYDQALKSLGKGKVQLAVEHLRQAVALYPDYLVARNDLGVQYLKLKRLEEAAEQFQAVIVQSPKYFNARLNLGLVLVEQKRYAEAVNQLGQAMAIDSTRPAAHLGLGIALLQTNELPGAERELTKALITGGADFIVAHYYLAQVYLRRGDGPEAAREFKVYLEVAPKGEYAEDARLRLKELEPRK